MCIVVLHLHGNSDLLPVKWSQHSTAQHSTSTAQHSTAQHSTAQHSTAQHSTAQHRHYRFVAALQRDMCNCNCCSAQPCKTSLKSSLWYVHGRGQSLQPDEAQSFRRQADKSNDRPSCTLMNSIAKVFMMANSTSMMAACLGRNMYKAIAAP